MSMYRCDGCSKVFDTDEDPDCWESEGGFCEPCRGRQFEDGRALAREHHMDLNARGCTCQWVGANGDPDQHIKRDRNCSLHGIDPDYARDAMGDR